MNYLRTLNKETKAHVIELMKSDDIRNLKLAYELSLEDQGMFGYIATRIKNSPDSVTVDYKEQNYRHGTNIKAITEEDWNEATKDPDTIFSYGELKTVFVKCKIIYWGNFSFNTVTSTAIGHSGLVDYKCVGWGKYDWEVRLPSDFHWSETYNPDIGMKNHIKSICLKLFKKLEKQ